MADKEHVEILSRGKEVWNEWRKNNSHITPDLSGVNLCEIPKGWANFNLRNDGRNYGIQFLEFNFSYTILDEVYLRNQDISSLLSKIGCK
jgi:hypothetical protein